MRLIATLALILGLTSCVSIPEGGIPLRNLEPKQQGETVAYFVRPDMFTAAGVNYNLSVNNQVIAELPNCSFTRVEMVVNEYRVSTESTSGMSASPAGFSFVPEEGEEYFFVFDVDGTLTSFASGGAIIPVSSFDMTWRSANRVEATPYMIGCLQYEPRFDVAS